jgi:hypothetical protein
VGGQSNLRWSGPKSKPGHSRFCSQAATSRLDIAAFSGSCAASFAFCRVVDRPTDESKAQ